MRASSSTSSCSTSRCPTRTASTPLKTLQIRPGDARPHAVGIRRGPVRGQPPAGRAAGYLNKEAASTQLVGAIRTVVRGRKFVSPALAQILADGVTGDADKPLHGELSQREFQIFCKIAAGRRSRRSPTSRTFGEDRQHLPDPKVLEKMGMSRTRTSPTTPSRTAHRTDAAERKSITDGQSRTNADSQAAAGLLTLPRPDSRADRPGLKGTQWIMSALQLKHFTRADASSTSGASAAARVPHRRGIRRSSVRASWNRFRRDPNIEVVGEAETRIRGARRATERNWDAAVLDLQLRQGTGLRAPQVAAQRAPRARPRSSSPTAFPRQYRDRSFALGADYFFDKGPAVPSRSAKSSTNGRRRFPRPRIRNFAPLTAQRPRGCAASAPAPQSPWLRRPPRSRPSRRPRLAPKLTIIRLATLAIAIIVTIAAARFAEPFVSCPWWPASSEAMLRPLVTLLERWRAASRGGRRARDVGAGGRSVGHRVSRSGDDVSAAVAELPGAARKAARGDQPLADRASPMMHVKETPKGSTAPPRKPRARRRRPATRWRRVSFVGRSMRRRCRWAPRSCSPCCSPSSSSPPGTRSRRGRSLWLAGDSLARRRVTIEVLDEIDSPRSSGISLRCSPPTR